MNYAKESFAPARRVARLTAIALAASAVMSPAVLADPGYIESDGTQFINTGYHVNPSSKVELDFAFIDFDNTSAYVQTRLMDNHPTASFPNLACTVYVAGQVDNGNYTLAISTGDRNVEGSDKASHQLSGNWTTSSGYPNPDGRQKYCDSTVRTVSIDETTRYMRIFENGEEVWYLSNGGTYNATYTAKRPLILLGRPTNDAGSAADYRSRARIYGFRIYEDGELLHDYVPALKGGEAGLYDTKDGGFLPNIRAEGNPLAHGGDIREIPDDGYVSTFGNNSSAGIGELYFDTTYPVTKNTRAELDYALAMDYPTSGYDGNHNWYLFAGSGSSGYSRFNAYFNKTASASFGICGGGIHWKNPTPSIPAPTNQVNVRHVAFVDNYKGVAGMLTDGLTNSTYVTTAQADLNFSANTLKIAKSSKSNESGYAPLKIYGFKIYEEDALVRSYKPYVQNGIPGLLDTIGTGGFISAAVATNALNIGYGGLIDSDPFSCEAYVETDGTQYIDLGYYAQSDTRFELDCAVVKPDSTNDLYIFGTHGGYKAGNFPFSMFVKKNSTGLGWNCEANKSSYLALTSTRITAERQKFVLDGYRNEVSVLAADGTMLHTGTIDTDHANAKSPYEMAIGSSRGKNGVSTDPIKLKIYTARIYESGTLKHEFVPYVQNGVAGLWDTVDKVFKTAANSGANPLALSGMGVDGAEKWVTELPATAQVSQTSPKTLTAAAAGAKSYKWTLNGEEIAGATGETVTAEWRQGGYDRPDVYACTAIYDVFGVETEGEPVTCEVSRIAPAFIMVVR